MDIPRDSSDDQRWVKDELHMTLSVERVRQAANHFARGGSAYALWKADASSAPPLMGKPTAGKLRKFYEEGKLARFVSQSPAAEVVGATYQPANEPIEKRRARLGHEDMEDVAELLAEGARGELGVPTGRGEYLLEVVDRLPDVDWSLEVLEALGIPTGTCLKLLVEYDGLHVQRQRAERHYGDVDKHGRTDNVVRMLQEFPGLRRYIALHYLVHFLRHVQGTKPPFALAQLAADMYSEGVLESDSRYLAAGEDIFRYQVWRGDQFLAAYVKAGQRLWPKRRWKNMAARIQAVGASTNGSIGQN